MKTRITIGLVILVVLGAVNTFLLAASGQWLWAIFCAVTVVYPLVHLSILGRDHPAAWWIVHTGLMSAIWAGVVAMQAERVVECQADLVQHHSADQR